MRSVAIFRHINQWGISAPAHLGLLHDTLALVVQQRHVCCKLLHALRNGGCACAIVLQQLHHLLQRHVLGLRHGLQAGHSTCDLQHASEDAQGYLAILW